MMVVAAVFLWANVQLSPKPDNFWNGNDLLSDVSALDIQTQGWPIPALFHYSEPPIYQTGRIAQFFWGPALIDLTVALATMLVTVSLSEGIIRRRSKP